MARVSLKEAYDNKDVVAQIYAIRDIAEGASDTADSAKTTADDAKTYVDTLGVQVEGAVQTANNASASAQESAETVAGYDARLTEVEGDLNQAESDIDGLETGLGAVTARVVTAEGNIVTIQGRVTALETADGQNVKINNINAYAVGLTGDQNVYGIKTMRTGTEGKVYYRAINTATNVDNTWAKGFSLTMPTNYVLIVDVVCAFNNTDVQDATVKIIRTSANTLRCIVLDTRGTIAEMAGASNYVATLDGNTVTFYTKKVRRYTNLRANVWFYSNYGGMVDLPDITWHNETSSDPSTETHDVVSVGAMIGYHNVV